jgi:hypothetical protein
MALSTYFNPFRSQFLTSFSDLVRDNMIFNIKGIAERGQCADMNMEHNIGYVKVGTCVQK